MRKFRVEHDDKKFKSVYDYAKEGNRPPLKPHEVADLPNGAYILAGKYQRTEGGKTKTGFSGTGYVMHSEDLDSCSHSIPIRETDILLGQFTYYG